MAIIVFFGADERCAHARARNRITIAVARRRPHNSHIPPTSPKNAKIGLPRANVAASAEKPEGSDPSIARRDYTVLQQHVAFFDRDDDGVIWPWDT